ANVATSLRSAPATRLTDRVAQIDARRRDGRGETEREAARDRNCGGKSEHAEVDAHFAELRKRRSGHADERALEHDGDRYAGRAAGDSVEGAFSQHLADE